MTPRGVEISAYKPSGRVSSAKRLAAKTELQSNSASRGEREESIDWQRISIGVRLLSSHKYGLLVGVKTTLEFPDDLFRSVKAKAAQEGISLKEYVAAALPEKLK